MTTNSISPELQKGFAEALQTGEEAKVRQFLTDHFKELPEGLQDDLIVALVQEALEKQTQEDNLIANFQKKGVAALDVLGNAEEEVEKHVKLKEIKKDIQDNS